MNLFGSRDEDPLLKDDPLAPTDDAPASEGRDVSNGSNRPAEQRREEPDRGETRTITHTQKEATEGALADLNQALGGGWRLIRVQLRDDGRFSFQLRRDATTSEEVDMIV